MAKEIKVPQISEGVETAVISEILVSEGDKIEEDQSVISVETDKATAEVPASSGGTIKEIKVSEGDEVNVGDVIIILEDDDDDSEEKEEEKTIEKEEDTSKKKKEDSEKDEEESDSEENKKDKSKSKEKDDEQEEDDEDEDEKDGDEKKKNKDTKSKKDKETDEASSKEVYASPGVRRLARELGVNIKEISGSGESGRITEKDVKEFQEGGSKKSSSGQAKLPDFSKWGAVETKPLNSIKKTTAKNVLFSWQTIPHVFQFGEADISGVETYIEDHKEKVEKAGGKLTLTAILTKIVATALHKFPTFNASIDMDKEEMILKKYVNINIAVATEDGLLVPVIKNADQKSIKDLSVEISEIAEKAREQKLSKEDMEGGNFSISNLGGIGGTNFTPIVYHPQVAILGISRATTKPVYIDGKFEPRSILPLSLSYDHRLIDGADGAGFMNWLVKALEDPYEALLG
ncbi:2-oxo acid dehydrogenase subunit E2 [Salegentibacter salarius]|uniref:Dihydrolipoamide acetyltransferase component of pyruvate dehydrogenase complex n=1 Tax=Salegentibacter salarius TaxID=435906 RepID=A0A2N0TUU3_9FLAO|nr:2-oxo acid dehydrogenase subunit E2 [Salegentibacter salarius]OEY72189.1 dihydrolipoyllysine acetyltransferase [Salegentibacter salarius]PKD18510.1 dihydrolipoyllysine acetyltransferase [Salegentibacter salarius]SLJ88054.1 pyruvate dehydrogenase E2 component (dihydrolipoamide acetyltransferase) [Salegentibacter salarius]